MILFSIQNSYKNMDDILDKYEGRKLSTNELFDLLNELQSKQQESIQNGDEEETKRIGLFVEDLLGMNHLKPEPFKNQTLMISGIHS